jgi:hypothetical protein
MARPLSEHSPHKDQFPETYRETVFMVWYSKGKPRPKVLWNMIEPDPMLGAKPSSTVLSEWLKNFREKASSLDTKVAEEVNTKLVADKVAMLERHASVAREMQETGLEYLKTHDLGGARNAITMVVEGLRIERESVGAPRIAQRVLDMSDDELVQELRVLVKETTVTHSLPNPEDVIDV